jgi:C-terminal processing protease CtpA/Prc
MDKGRVVELTWLDAAARPPSARCPFWGKTQASWLPHLGVTQWDSGTATVFPARIEAVNGRRYGVLRLYSYALSPEQQARAVTEVREALKRFTADRVDAVLIDQTGNGGGNYYLGLALLRDAFVRPLSAPRQRFLMRADGGVVGWGDREMLEAFVAGLEQQKGRHPFLAEKAPILQATDDSALGLARYFRFFLEQPRGTRLTAPHTQIGESTGPVGAPLYSGPIVLAIDELNLSAAEFVAATLLDGERATLFGTTTSGAGGDQRALVTARPCANGERDDSLPLFNCVPSAIAADLELLGIAQLSYTISLGVRASGQYIENVGVSPNVAYAPTAEDFKTGFLPMRNKLLEVLAAAGRSQ